MLFAVSFVVKPFKAFESNLYIPGKKTKKKTKQHPHFICILAAIRWCDIPYRTKLTASISTSYCKRFLMWKLQNVSTSCILSFDWRMRWAKWNWTSVAIWYNKHYSVRNSQCYVDIIRWESWQSDVIENVLLCTRTAGITEHVKVWKYCFCLRICLPASVLRRCKLLLFEVMTGCVSCYKCILGLLHMRLDIACFAITPAKLY